MEVGGEGDSGKGDSVGDSGEVDFSGLMFILL